MRVSKGYNELLTSDLEVKVVEVNGEYHDPSLGSIVLSSNWIADSSTNIQIFADIDLDRIKREFQFSEKDELTAVLRSYCKATTLQHFGQPVPLVDNIVKLNLLIPPFEWAEQSNIKISIIHMAVDNYGFIPGKAILNKSRLYERSWSFVLSGSYSRSDVQSVAFGASDGKKNGLWEIIVSAPIEIDSWITVEQSSVIRIRVNEERVADIEIPQVEMLLKVDMIMSSLEAVFNADISPGARDEIFEMMSIPPIGSGSWLRFLSNIFPIAFPQGSIGATQFWHSRKDEIRTRIQSYVSGVS
jgi:hypothetical protein